MPYSMDIALDVVRRIGISIEPNFKLTDKIKKTYIKLIQWFHGDTAFESTSGYLNKGILLVGNTGSGKTLAMQIMARYRDIDNIIFAHNDRRFKLAYDVVDVNTICRSFSERSYEGISRYCFHAVLCIDDLGYEVGVNKFYGNTTDVLSYIIGERYRLNKLTMATSNLPIENLAEKYDDRTASRIYGLFNCIEMIGGDFRKTDIAGK